MREISVNIASNLDCLLYSKYGQNQYFENKAKLFGFLKQIQKNNDLDTDEIKKLLEAIKPIFKKLKNTQNKIKKQKSLNVSTSFINRCISKFQRITILFKRFFYGDHRLNKLILLAKKIEKDNKKNEFKVKTERTKKFKGIVKKIQKTIARGTCVKDAICLDQSYWLETNIMKLIFGEERYAGHIYTGHLTKLKFFEQWSLGKDSKGIPYQEQYSFEEYLNRIVISNLPQKELEDLKGKCTIVEYHTPEELATLEAHFDDEGNIYSLTPHLNAWVDSNVQDPKSEQYYSDFYQSFQLSSAENNLEKQYILRDATFMYLLDHKGRLYLQIKKQGMTNHTSLSKGQAILAAGSLEVKDGKIISIDTFSGHYKPTQIQLKNFLLHLVKSKVNLDMIKLTYVSEYAVQPWKINVIHSKDVRHWFNQAVLGIFP